MKQQSKIAAFFGMNKYERKGTVAVLLVLIVLAIAITVNALTGLLPYSIAHPNVTGSDTYRISGTSADWLKTLDTDVTLYLICTGGKNAVDGDIYGFLLDYEEACERVQVEVIDPSVSSDFIFSYGGEWPADMSVIVESEARYKLIETTDLYYYYNSSVDRNLTPEEYQETINLFSESSEYASYLSDFISTTTPYFDGESRVTNAINFVTREDVPIAYTLTGSGSSELDSSLKTLLSNTCYDMRTTLSVAALPEDCDILIINAPSIDLTDVEAAALAQYLANGGKLFLTTYYGTQTLPKLEEVLSTYGLGFEDSINVVMESHSSYAFSDSSGSYHYLFNTHIDSSHAATSDDFDSSFVAYYPHAIKMTETDGVTQTAWLYTSEAGYLMTHDEETQKWTESEEKNAYNIGVIAEKGETQIVWISSPDALVATINSYSENGNFSLTLSAMNYMSGIGTDSISIASAAMESSMLNVTFTEFLIYGILFVLVIPIAIAVAGIIIWYSRKRR